MKAFNKTKKVIILFGPPGAGKGTQASLLAEKFNLYYFETSKILEQKFKESLEEVFIIDGKKYSVLKEKELWEQGILCSPPFVTFLVKENIKKLAEEGKSLILAGSPRTVYEGEKIIPLLKDLYGQENIKVFLIEISSKETIFRNSHRKICELLRHPILYNKETEKLTICPLDGSKLLKREGLDDPETIKKRLVEYKNRTIPIIEIFKRQGIKIKKVNGEQNVVDVFKDISKELENKKIKK